MPGKTGLLLFLVFYLIPNPFAFAEGTIIYDGSQLARSTLKPYQYVETDSNQEIENKNVLYIGDSASPSAQSHNTVIVIASEGTENDPFCVFGGMLNENSIGTVEWNKVIIHDGKIPYYISGGDAIGNASRYNTVEIYGGTLKEVYGGSLWGKGDGEKNEVYGNRIVMSGGTINSDSAGFSIQIDDSGVYGGQIYNPSENENYVYDNHVIIQGNAEAYGVFGGQLGDKGNYYGVVENNSVIVRDSAKVIAGKALAGGWGQYGAINNNSVFIQDAAVVEPKIYGGFVFKEGSANHNRVTISGEATTSWIYGGRSFGESEGVVTGACSADDNIVTIIGTGIYIKGDIHGGSVGSGSTAFDSRYPLSANNNVVRIGGLTFVDDYPTVCGGYSAYFYAQNNLVEICDSTRLENGYIYGGYIENPKTDGGDNNQATNNTVTISGNPLLNNTSLFGGKIQNETGGDAFTGNTLNIQPSTAQGITVKSTANFEFYNFQIPKNIQNGDTLLNITGTATLEDSSNPSNVSRLTVAASGLPRLQLNERFHLLQAATLSGTIGNNGDVLDAESRFLRYSFLLTQETNSIDAVLNRIEVRPQGKAVAEPLAASLIFLNQNVDLLTDYGIGAAERFGLQNGNNGWRPFAYFRGAAERVETGSSVDANGFHVVAGLSRRFCWRMQPVLLGGFAEYGLGDYSTFNQFADNSINNSGNINYLGGGMFARIRYGGGYYMEGGARAGSLQTNFWMNFSDEPQPLACDYKTSYVGSFAGFGRLFHWGGNSTHLDLSAKYLWTRMNRNALDADDLPFLFRGTDSSRLRFGVQLSHDSLGASHHSFGVSCDSFNRIWNAYAGLAYEYELGGSVRATVVGMNVDAPQLRGGSGIGELGVVYSPFDCLSVNFAVQGYTGKRNGGNLSLTTNWRF
ncbi:MAG: hypothetical protein LBT05_06305 [Planctomycetaceae bacterium]|jgi:hypothetical protein|nr:hypothetical protein [Planctomycetaceae bacterium]